MWIQRLRLRALVYLVGIVLAAAGSITLVGLPWVPVVGVAVAAAAATMNSLALRLAKPTCWACGQDVSGSPPAEQGVLCPGCGALNQPPAWAKAVRSLDERRNV